jgi:hypothetical protein
VRRIHLQRSLRGWKVLQSFDDRIEFSLHGNAHSAGLAHCVSDLVVTMQQSL